MNMKLVEHLEEEEERNKDLNERENATMQYEEE